MNLVCMCVHVYFFYILCVMYACLVIIWMHSNFDVCGDLSLVSINKREFLNESFFV